MLERKTKVSVIIPVHNGEQTIHFAILSVLAQSFKDFELIIVESGSTDKTLRTVLRFKDQRVRILIPPKANVAVNRNLGIDYCAGEFITFLDADDTWTVDKLKDQYDLFQNSAADVGLVYSFVRSINDWGKINRKCNSTAHEGDVYPLLLLDDFIGCGSNAMVRKSVFEDVGSFDTQLTNCQDTDMWLRIAAKYKFACVPKQQINYRTGEFSMSSDLRGLEKSKLKILNRNFSSQRGLEYLYLRRKILANSYKFLLFKSLQSQTYPGDRMKYFLSIIRYDFFILRCPVMYKMLIYCLTLSLPTETKFTLECMIPKLFKIETILGYIETSLPKQKMCKRGLGM